MKDLLSNYTENANFWNLYPIYKKPKVLNEVYKKDKSKSKKKSSNIMWGIVFMFERSAANPYRNLPLEEKIDVINEDIMEDPEFNWDEYTEAIEYMHNSIMSELEKTYYSFEEKMQERRLLIETTEYTLDNAETLDKIIKATDALRKELLNIKKSVEDAESDFKTKGDIKLSAGEMGEI